MNLWIFAFMILSIECRLDLRPSSTSVTQRHTSPPKITLLSHMLIGDTIDIATDSTIRLRCTGQRPLMWIFPNNNIPYEQFERYTNMTTSMSCDVHSNHPKQIPSKCRSDVVIYDAKYDMTGFFTCQYNQSEESPMLISGHQNSDTIYIFVNDAANLIVPYESSTEFMFIAVFQSQPATIPCRPTYSRASVSLWKIHTKSSIPQEIKPNSSLGITYNPKKGFYFEHPRWDSETNVLECRYEVNGNKAIAAISLHWSILPNELHPIIDDTEARHVFLNDTFTLKCFVHIEIGVIIVIDWDYPNRINSTRKILKSQVETTRVNVNGNSYDTVAINITVVNATAEDQGEYRCNVTDGNGRTFTATKKLTIHDEHLPPTVNFTSDFDTSEPIIREVGEDVRFMVMAHAFPDISLIELSWYKDGLRIEHNNPHYEIEIFSDILTQISFYIQKSRPSDSGTYTLVGNSSFMTTNISMTIHIKGEPEVVLSNVLPFYVRNRTYEVTCKSYSYPISNTGWFWLPCLEFSCFESKSPSGEWQNLSSGTKVANKAAWKSLPQNDYLNATVMKIHALESGFYKCFGSNIYGQTSQLIPFIVMDHDQIFSIIASTEEPTLNDTVVLTCKASVFRFSKVKWTMTRLDEKIQSDVVNTTNVQVTEDLNEYSMSTTILLRNIQFNDSALFSCEATYRNAADKIEHKDYAMAVKNVSTPVVIQSNMKENIIDVSHNSQMELKCYLSGRPWPTIVWLKNGNQLPSTLQDSGIKIEDRGQRLVFTRLMDKDSGLYECRATNRGGQLSRKAYLRVKGYDDETLQTSEVLITLFLAIIGAIMILMAVFIGKKIRQEKIHKRELEFFSKSIFETGQMELFNPEMPLDEQIDLLPYDSRFEFPKERLRLGRTLGQGAFGRVVKAEAIGLESDESSTTVAVKMLKERADANQRKALLAELKILIHLGRHLNIVNLLGAVTKNLVKGELLVIVEYCEFGNLRHFLMSNRDYFVNQLNPITGEIDKSITHNITNGQAYQNVDIISSAIKQQEYLKNGSIRYVDLLHQSTSSDSDYINTGGESNGSVNPNPSSDPKMLTFNNRNYIGSRASQSSITSKRAFFRNNYQKAQEVATSDLLCYAFQCARGMDYLTSRKLIHRDLAARNVLLASNNVVKICDFGLAKDVYKYDNYVKKNDGPLPIKWMAIESISDKVFTSKSDVWSFGILLWEVFTLGKNPYPGVEIDEEFYKRLKNGYRMEKPEFASTQLYELMLKCWNASPGDRPNFEEISNFIGDLMDEKVRQHFIELNNPYSEMNQQILGNNDYLKMTSMYAGCSEEYLKMNEEEEDSRITANNATVAGDTEEQTRIEMSEIKSDDLNIAYDNLHVAI